MSGREKDGPKSVPFVTLSSMVSRSQAVAGAATNPLAYGAGILVTSCCAIQKISFHEQ